MEAHVGLVDCRGRRYVIDVNVIVIPGGRAVKIVGIHEWEINFRLNVRIVLGGRGIEQRPGIHVSPVVELLVANVPRQSSKSSHVHQIASMANGMYV